MSEAEASCIPETHAVEIRRLVHDLSNALEIIVQTSYLLRLGELDEKSQQWLKMLDGGVHQAADLSTQLRSYVMEHAAGVEDLARLGSSGSRQEGGGG